MIQGRVIFRAGDLSATGSGAIAVARGKGAVAKALVPGAGAWAAASGAVAKAAASEATALAMASGSVAIAKAFGASARAEASGAVAKSTKPGSQAHAVRSGAQARALAAGAVANAYAEGSIAYQSHPTAQVHSGSGKAVVWKDYRRIQGNLAIWQDLRCTQQQRADAAYAIGMQFYKGNGVTQSDTLTVHFLTQAYQLNHGDAAYELAKSYMERSYFRRDSVKAREWCQKVPNTSRRYREAQYFLTHGIIPRVSTIKRSQVSNSNALGLANRVGNVDANEHVVKAFPNENNYNEFLTGKDVIEAIRKKEFPTEDNVTLIGLSFSLEDDFADIEIPANVTLKSCEVTRGRISFFAGELFATRKGAIAVANGKDAVANAVENGTFADARGGDAVANAMAPGAVARAWAAGARANATVSGAKAEAWGADTIAEASAPETTAYARHSDAVANASAPTAKAYAWASKALANAKHSGAEAFAEVDGAIVWASVEDAVGYQVHPNAEIRDGGGRTVMLEDF